ncbi:MAG: DUF4157 domain-containing protein [Ferruginibacter sp.]
MNFINDINKASLSKNSFGVKKLFFQPKLTINTPNDQYEQEADAIADKVMRMAKPGVQLKPLPIIAIQRKCAHCEDEEQQLQRKETNDEEVTADYNLESHIRGLSGGGQPLPNDLRNFYEPRFGYDFSNVKIHTNTDAAKSAESINALAYTSGNHIVFNSGEFSPGTDTGKKLLGHELTHVVQQADSNSMASRSIMRKEKKPEDKYAACSATQQSKLKPIMEDARKAVTLATSVVATSWAKPDKIPANRKQLLLDHFHTTKRSDLRDILGNYISLGQSFSSGLKIKCENTCPKDPTGNVCGYAYNTQWFGGFGPIHICFDTAGCDFTTSAQPNQIALLIHEAAHRHTGVDDKAYLWETKYSSLSAGAAKDNADSYGWFAALL